MEGFTVTTKELRDLMEERGRDAFDKLQTDYGGVLELCKRLKTSPNEGMHKHLVMVILRNQLNRPLKIHKKKVAVTRYNKFMRFN